MKEILPVQKFLVSWGFYFHFWASFWRRAVFSPYSPQFQIYNRVHSGIRARLIRGGGGGGGYCDCPALVGLLESLIRDRTRFWPLSIIAFRRFKENHDLVASFHTNPHLHSVLVWSLTKKGAPQQWKNRHWPLIQNQSIDAGGSPVRHYRRGGTK